MKRAAKSNHRGLEGGFVVASLKRGDDDFGMEQTAQRRFRCLPLAVRLETVGGVATPLVLHGTPLAATLLGHIFNSDRNSKVC